VIGVTSPPHSVGEVELCPESAANDSGQWVFGHQR
jgi:hypothetical protein